MPATYIATKDLPPCLREALKDSGYNRPDVTVQAAESADTSGAAFEGNRSFITMVNLNTGAFKVVNGSWGGANPYELRPTDNGESYKIEPGGAAIVGETGGRGSFARILVHPSNLAPMLPSSGEVSDREKSILAIFRGYKPAYRKAALGNTPEAEIDALIARGFLKRNKAGATGITTAGKNASR